MAHPRSPLPPGSPVLLVLATMLSASPAAATPFEATLAIAVGGFGSVSLAGAHTGTSETTLLAVPGGTFAGGGSLPVFGVPPISVIRVKVVANANGSFTGDPLHGTMPIYGAAAWRGNVGFGPFTLFPVPLFTNHTPSSGEGRVGIGVGGSVSLTIPAVVYLRAYHTDWTEGAKTLQSVTYFTYYHFALGMMASLSVPYPYVGGTAMYTGTDSRTPGGLGQVTLISPTRVVTNLTGPPLILVMLGTLTLSFVPEPGTLLLLGSGVAALAALGRRRLRR